MRLGYGVRQRQPQAGPAAALSGADTVRPHKALENRFSKIVGNPGALVRNLEQPAGAFAARADLDQAE